MNKKSSRYAGETAYLDVGRDNDILHTSSSHPSAPRPAADRVIA